MFRTPFSTLDDERAAHGHTHRHDSVTAQRATMTPANAVVGLSVAALAAGTAAVVRVTGALHVVSAAIADTSSSIWPTSIAGWAALFLAAVACIATFVGWGKLLARFDEIGKTLNGLTSNVAAVKLTADRIEDDLTLVQHTIWGPRGDDGMSEEVRGMIQRVDAIEARNNVRDALYELERGAREHGDERRNSHRRIEDQILLGEREGHTGEKR
jgi:hypothetical protein